MNPVLARRMLYDDMAGHMRKGAAGRIAQKYRKTDTPIPGAEPNEAARTPESELQDRLIHKKEGLRTADNIRKDAEEIDLATAGVDRETTEAALENGDVMALLEKMLAGN